MTDPEIPAEALSAERAPRPISAIEAVVGTFSRPDFTFTSLMKSPTWWLPFLLLLGTYLGSAILVAPKIDTERTVREAMEKRVEKSGQTVSPQQVERGVEVSKKIAAWSIPISIVFGALAFFFVALVLWGSARAFGSECSFAQVLSIWGHAGLVNACGAIVAILILMQQPNSSLTQGEAAEFVKSNVGAFLPDSIPHFVRTFAGSFDIFSLATLALLVIGFRRLPALPRGTATAIPIVLWAIFVLAKTGWVAVFG